MKGGPIMASHTGKIKSRHLMCNSAGLYLWWSSERSRFRIFAIVLSCVKLLFNPFSLC